MKLRNITVAYIYLFPDFMCQSITIAQRIKSLVRITRILFRVSLQTVPSCTSYISAVLTQAMLTSTKSTYLKFLIKRLSFKGYNTKHHTLIIFFIF
jgi:hypothetical protein